MSSIYQNNIISLNYRQMKKNKIQKDNEFSKPIMPICFSSKKGSLPGNIKHQNLFTPYKIDWKQSEGHNIENTNNRSFFKNMKHELSNIKNDVQRLIKKDIQEDHFTKNYQENITQKSYPRPKSNSLYVNNGNIQQNMKINEKQTHQQFDEQSREETKQTAQLNCLEKKVNYLEAQNKQILDKLFKIEKRLNNPSQGPSQSEHNSVFDSLCQSINKKNQIQEIQSTNQKQLKQLKKEKDGSSQKVQQKLQLLEQQLQKMQIIILELQSVNKGLVKENDQIIIQLQEQKDRNRQSSQVNTENLNKIKTIQIQKEKEKELLILQFLAQRQQMQRDINNMNQQLKDLKTNIQAQQLQNKKFNLQNLEIIGQIKAEKSRNQYYEKQLSNKIQQIQTLNTKNLLTQQSNNTQKKQIENLQNNKRQLIDKLQTLKSKYQVLQKSNNSLIEQLSTKKFNETETKQCQIDRQINNYKKKLDLANNQVQNLKEELINAEIEQKQKQIQMQKLLIQREKQNQQLSQQLISQSETRSQLEKQIQQLKKTVETIRHQTHQVTKMNSEALGKEFQVKISQAYNQLYGYKKKVSLLQASLAELNVKNTSLKEALRVYEERDAQLANRKGTKAQEWEEMLQQLTKLKDEKQQLIQSYELSIMKLQNQIDSIKNGTKIENNIDVNMNILMKNNLEEIEKLRLENREKHQQINKLRIIIHQKDFTTQSYNETNKILNERSQNICEDLSSSKIVKNNVLHCELESQKKKLEYLTKIIQTKNKDIRTKQEFIYNALSSKITNIQDESHIQSLLKDLNSIMGRQIINYC